MSTRVAVRSIVILLLVLWPFPSVADDAREYRPVFGRLASGEFENLINAAEAAGFRGELRDVELTLNTPQGRRKFLLRPHDIRSPSFRVALDGEILIKPSGEPEDIELFRGTLAETASDFIRLSIMRHGALAQLGGMLRIEGSTFTLRTDSGDPLAYEIYEVSPAAMRQLFLRCGLDTEHVSPVVSERQVRPAGILIAELATDADYSFVRAEGGAQQANAKIVEIVNGVDAIYRAEHGIGIELSFQHAWTEPDPYRGDDANALLDSFADYWSEFLVDQASFDVAHLWTDASFGGGTIGLAFLGSTCNRFSYSFSRHFPSVSVAAELAAHEIGHNFNAVHDTGCQFPPQWVMCPFQDPSRVNTNFSPYSKDSISSFIAAAECLELLEAAAEGEGGNRAPVISDPGHQTISEGNVLNITFSASDPDGDLLVFSSPEGLPAGASLGHESGVFSWAPQGTQSGEYAIKIEVRDSAGAGASLIFTLTVEKGIGITPLLTREMSPNLDGSGGADLVTYRPSSGVWYSNDFVRLGRQPQMFTAEQFGLPGDIPVPADYNGDRVTDRAVFRPRTSTWFIYFSNSGRQEALPFGSLGDLPAPGDYDGDGRADLAVYRPRDRAFIYRSSSRAEVVRTVIGEHGDIPIPCDYTGDGTDNIALFRPGSATWLIQTEAGVQTFNFGLPNDIPRPADFSGEGFCRPAVWRPATGEWHFQDQPPVQFGLPGDFPLAQDVDGDGAAELTVWRPAGAVWFIRKPDGSADATQFGLPGDLLPGIEPYLYGLRNRFGDTRLVRNGEPDEVWLFRTSSSELLRTKGEQLLFEPLSAPSGSFLTSGDFDGDGKHDIAVFKDGGWQIHFAHGAVESRAWGIAGDRPMPADFDGDGVSDLAVFRADNGSGQSYWYIIQSSNGTSLTFPWGLAGDIPLAADFNGDGITDAAVWRETIGTWFVRDGRSGGIIEVTEWGLPGDLPKVADINNDGRAERIIWRPSLGTWFIHFVDTSIQVIPWGINGDKPFIGRFFGPSVESAVFRPLSGELYFRNVETGSIKQTAGFNAEDQLVGVQPHEPVF